ncbi:MAG: hypothetical protein RLO08_06445 [Parvibaculaceae bacterium]
MFVALCDLFDMSSDEWKDLMSVAFFFAVAIPAVGPFFFRLFVAKGKTEEEVIQLTNSLRMYTKEADQYLNVVGRIYRRAFSFSVLFLVCLIMLSCQMKNSC